MLATAKPSSFSWFVQIRDICLMYGLPHPLTLLQSPIPKPKFKKQSKQAVQDYWQQKLREEAAQLDSLSYFNPLYMSLSTPHPLWLTTTSNPYEINKAVVQARMLSGRYRSEGLCRFWSANPNGYCLLQSYSDTCLKEDISHILLHCPSLSTTRANLRAFFETFSGNHPEVSNNDTLFLNTYNTTNQIQFLLDCSTGCLLMNETKR